MNRLPTIRARVGSGIHGTRRTWVTAVLALVALVGAPMASAIETVGAIRGAVVAPSGEAVGSATVTVTDTRTGRARTATTDETGSFFLGSLEVGGPYTVTVRSSRYPDRALDDIRVGLGQTYNLTVQLGGGTIEEMVVTAEAISSAAVAVGPSTNFDLVDLESAPAINRDIKDLIRLDPRVYVDEAFVDAIQCNGANPRFNSLTVDGVRLNDLFGLNSNGYPTERIPFSYDAIQQVAVEMAPFDVQYGGFSACNVNAVTKSGSNEFTLSAFYDYTDDGWQGDELEGDAIDLGEFEEERYGVSVGGPIIRDRLFFFAAYEELEGAAVFDRGPVGSGAGREIAGLSQADYDEILRISREVYDYEPGGLVSSLPEEDEKFLLKLNANLTDQHRAAFTWTYNDGFSIAESDSDNDEFEFSNHYYERGAELNSYVGQIFSDWNENLSTELRVSYLDLENRQISLAGSEFGEVQIDVENDADGDGNPSTATVYLGGDDSRQANQLSYENWSYKFKANYAWNNHYFTLGFERDELEVFNLFIQEAQGEFRFDSVADFAAGLPARVIYENAAPTNVPADAAAEFQYEINAVYLQDEIYFADRDLTVVAGVRYDWYTSDDEPRTNPNFAARYGYSNAQNLDGADLIQPRVAFDWGVTDDLRLRGGVGVFSGGNPNVWISNNYSNDGFTQVEQNLFGLDAGETLFTIPTTGDGRAIYDIPQELFDGVASGTADSGVNVLDPEFEIPYSVKVNLGAQYLFDAPWGLGEDYLVNADLIYSEFEDSAIIRDITLERTGTAADGRALYRGIDRADPDCLVPTSAECSGRTQDFQLSNVSGDDAEQTVFSLSLAKSYASGLSWAAGYAYTESEDVNPMTSSVAFSNYANIATADPNDPGTATSNYEIPHRFTLKLQYERAFWADNMTRVTLFGSYNEGRPYSFVFDGVGFGFGDPLGFIDRQLLYVPTGPNDPIVNFDPAFDQDAFFAFVDDADLGRGQIADRNSNHSSWWAKFDVKVEQEFPLPLEGKGKAFLIIENLGNLLNDDWGVLKEGGFPRSIPLVDADYDAGAGQYTFNRFIDATTQGRATDASLWELRAGIRVDF